MKKLLIQHWSTHRGCRVYFMERHEIPFFELAMIFPAGSSSDENQYGISNMTNIMLNQGSIDMTASQIAARFESAGAQFYATSNRDLSIVGLRSLSLAKYRNEALNAYRLVLCQPEFPQQNFANRKSYVLNIIHQQNHIPELILKKIFFEKLYKDHPYAHPVLGTSTTLDTLRRKDLLNYHHSHYTNKNSILILVGDMTRKIAENISHDISMHLPVEGIVKEVPKAPLKHHDSIHRIFFPSEQTHLLLGQLGVGPFDDSYFPLIVGNMILGGSTTGSRLFNELREKHGLTYSVVSILNILLARGPFAIILQTQNKEANRALKIARQVFLKFVMDGPNRKELNVAKKIICNNFLFTLSRNDMLIDYLTQIGFYHFPLEYLNKYCDYINNVTTAQIKDAFQRCFDTKNMIEIMVGSNTINQDRRIHS